MYRLKGYFIYLKTFIIYVFARIISIFVKSSNSYKNLWLISERGKGARDNGYHLFKYICQTHPEINCAYVITEDSADYQKVAQLGRIVKSHSLNHYLSFINAKALISTHICGYTTHMYFFNELDKRFNIFKGKKVFLQHGITKENIEELHYPNSKLDLFVCGAKREYEELKKSFNHPDGVMQLLGFCRFDNLHTDINIKKQILLMPTWRKSLITCTSEEKFKKSNYYIHFQNLINDKRFISILEKHGYTLAFYPHYEIQKYINTFSSSSSAIHISSFDKYDVQQLLKESAMLITDYSSVFFDSSYMKKPLIYYAFDHDEYNRTHYTAGYFSFERDGFGKVTYTQDELVDEFSRIMDNDLKIDDIYLKRIESFFGEISNDNCKKNYEAIKKLLDE